MAEGKDKFDINNDQKLKQDNLDKSDGPIAKTEILDGQQEHGNQSHVSEPTADGVIFPGNDSIHDTETRADTDFSSRPIHDTEDRADADFRPGNENFDINNDQKIAFDKSDGPIAKTEILDGQPEQGILGQANGMTGGDAENYNAGTNWVKTDTPIHDTEERADADIIPGDVPKVELNQGLGDYVKDGDNLSSDHIAKTEILDGQPEQGILGQANGAPNVSGDVVNMADMHSHMDDAAEHQVPEGPPQDPQGMGLDRLGTQFDEDGMADMHKPDDPNDGGEVV